MSIFQSEVTLPKISTSPESARDVVKANGPRAGLCAHITTCRFKELQVAGSASERCRAVNAAGTDCPGTALRLECRPYILDFKISGAAHEIKRGVTLSGDLIVDCYISIEIGTVALPDDDVIAFLADGRITDYLFKVCTCTAAAKPAVAAVEMCGDMNLVIGPSTEMDGALPVDSVRSKVLSVADAARMPNDRTREARRHGTLAFMIGLLNVDQSVYLSGFIVELTTAGARRCRPA